MYWQYSHPVMAIPSLSNGRTIILQNLGNRGNLENLQNLQHLGNSENLENLKNLIIYMANSPKKNVTRGPGG